MECSNGQSGFGRRRREVKAMAPDPNKLFEVTLTTFIKVDYEEGSIANKGYIKYSYMWYVNIYKDSKDNVTVK